MVFLVTERFLQNFLGGGSTDHAPVPLRFINGLHPSYNLHIEDAGLDSAWGKSLLST